MAQDLKIGDVVTLKSGGPKMTIEDLNEYSTGYKASCSWFNGSKRENELFAPEALKLAEE